MTNSFQGFNLIPCLTCLPPEAALLKSAKIEINNILRAFLLYPEGVDDQRVRRLPIVEAWLPRGAEAERLAGLGGIVPADIAKRLEQRLANLLERDGEELLGQSSQAEQVLRYDLAAISSAQLRHSLLGSSLSIFVPQSDGRTQQHVVPFHSPAIAWFLPLFTRLRVLLTGPYRNS